ncbi:HAD-IA family hydrolase [Actimicrobium sp. CCI2.3]|uniref:HAD family hydrolase n=1 Tax=Actimicrobium sp. CCI2.3 TaxID=3048616 RepID=UPI002AB5D390|nr:HAD-IA family hydrolase [Actimicrobium sp. CCI2.3]MDY7575953.1 HAD-IA family hydrolase [Actimicrobium sp. CCI2.3]MEB0023219.1 HAD-IA family hydrolase [Actimicrobium sp. CCI2.3]
MLLATPRVILFDLDGTLVDSAPDLAGAMNRLQRERGLPLSPYDLLRPHASAGARGLIFAAFGIRPEDHDYEALRVAFLDIYAANIAENSHLFSGITNLLNHLHQRDIAWGIVTNKAARFTDALVPQLALSAAACVVSGDTTPHAKPHPAPLLEAARQIGVAAEQCWYVGDDLRDIEAGRAAGMATVSVGWGYGNPHHPIAWDADMHATTPADLMTLITPGA